MVGFAPQSVHAKLGPQAWQPFPHALQNVGLTAVFPVYWAGQVATQAVWAALGMFPVGQGSHAPAAVL